MIEMSRYGYNKKEPLEVFIDKPTCFKNAYNLFKNELYYSTEDIIDFMALPRDIINDIFSFDRIIKLKLIKS
jgi:hypothetical protein